MEVERFLNTQSLDLNTLYQQDVDLGVDWLNFEPVKSVKEDQFVEQKKTQVLYPENFIIDGETGEYLPAPQNNVTSDPCQENITETGVNTNEQEFNIDECLDFLQSSINSSNGEDIQSELTNFQGVTDLATLIETTESTVTEPISTTIWDDIATLSELTGIGFEANDDSMNSGNMHQMQYHAVEHFQNDSFENMTQVNQQSDHHSPAKDHYSMEKSFPSFPTPPYNDQSESPNNFVPHSQAIRYSTDSDQSYNPSFEETNMTELLLSQQPDLFMGLDNSQIAQQPPTNQVMSPGSWFFGGEEPAGNLNLQQELTELDLGNEIQSQPSAFLNPPNAPFVPPPLSSDSDSGSLVDGGMTNHMDVEMMEQDTLVKQENQILMTINSQTFAAELQEEKRGKEEKRLNQRESRDLKKARELGITLTLEQIINSPVEEYNELLARTPMTAAQQSLVRDIRRRGKNKVAAQNCRKRKIETISSMEVDIDELNMKRQTLVMKQKEIEATRKALKSKYAQLYQKIFHSLRDDTGRPYDPSRFTLEQVEGAVILVPRSARRENVGNEKMDTSNRTVAFFDLSKVKIEKEDM